MKDLKYILKNVMFFGLIGYALYWTGNIHCLWALLLMPRDNSLLDYK